MKKFFALFLMLCALNAYAADTLDTIRISVEQPDYLAYDNEQGMWLYEGSAKVNNVNYKVFLNWYTYSEDMTGTFSGSDIDDYTYNQGGIVANNFPRLLTDVTAVVTGDRNTAIHIDATLKGWGPTSTAPVIYLCDLNWSKPQPKDTIEYIIPKGEFILTNSDSTIFRGKTEKGWEVSLCYDSYIQYTGEKARGHVFDKNTYLAYLKDTITPLTSPTAVITLDENRMYHLYAEIFGADENLHVIKLDAPVPTPKDTVVIHKYDWELDDMMLPDEWACRYFGDDYQIELYIPASEVKSGNYVGDQIYGYITVISPEGTYNNYNTVFINATFDIQDTCRIVNADVQAENGTLYKVALEYHLPPVKDTVDVTFQNIEFFDNIQLVQNVTFLGYSPDSLYYLSMNLYTNEIPNGTYNEKDVYRSFILHYLTEPGDEANTTQGFMLYGNIDVEFDGVDSIFLSGEMLCTDSIVYRFNLRTAWSVSKQQDGDTQTGELIRYYGEDAIVNTEFGYYLKYSITNPDLTEQLVLWFTLSETDFDIVVPEGTYPINSTAAPGTVFASAGINQSTGEITPSFFASLVIGDDGDLYYTDPLYFIVDGTVTVEKVDGQMVMTVDAVNSYGVKVYICYGAAATDLQNTKQENIPTIKRIENGQLIIIRENRKFNILGTSIN